MDVTELLPTTAENTAKPLSMSPDAVRSRARREAAKSKPKAKPKAHAKKPKPKPTPNTRPKAAAQPAAQPEPEPTREEIDAEVKKWIAGEPSKLTVKNVKPRAPHKPEIGSDDEYEWSSEEAKLEYEREHGK